MDRHLPLSSTRGRTQRSLGAHLARVAVAAPLVVLVAASCAQVLGLDEGETILRDCDDDADCADPCQITACVEGRCLRSNHTGQPLIAFAEEGCLATSCDKGSLVKVPKAQGAPCGTDDTGGLTCTADGTCGGCSQDEQCGKPDIELDETLGPTFCRAPKCSDAVCEVRAADAGPAPYDDLVGDCYTVLCDGQSLYAAGATYNPGDPPQPTGNPADDPCLGYCDDAAGGLVRPDYEPCLFGDMTVGICCGGVCTTDAGCLAEPAQ